MKNKEMRLNRLSNSNVKIYKIIILLYPFLNLLLLACTFGIFNIHEWMFFKILAFFYLGIDIFIILKNDIRFYSTCATVNIISIYIVIMLFAFLSIYTQLAVNSLSILILLFIGSILLSLRQLLVPDYQRMRNNFYKHQCYLNEGIIWLGEKSAPFVWYRGTKTQRLLQKIWELIALGLCLPALYLLFLERYTPAGKNALVMAIVGLLGVLSLTQLIAIMIYKDILFWKATRHIKKRFIWGTTG